MLACAALTLQSCIDLYSGKTSVRVGGEKNYDACAGVGGITALPGSDAKRAVYAKPELGAAITGYVAAGKYVWMCDMTDDRSWVGILHSHRKDGRIRCEVSSPIAKAQDYDGPCFQGWVPADTVVLFAG